MPGVARGNTPAVMWVDHSIAHEYSDVKVMGSEMRFITIPAAVLSRKDVGALPKMIFGALKFLQWQAEECEVKQATLAEMFSVSVRSVGTAIRQLAEAGLVEKNRRFKKSNRYAVVTVEDHAYLRVPNHIYSVPGVSPLTKLVAASLIYKTDNERSEAFVFQRKLAAELGCSRRSIVNTLNSLEKDHRIQVEHRGGGRHKGNLYRLTGGFYSAGFAHAVRESRKKLPNKHNDPLPVSTGLMQKIFAKAGLFGCHPTETPNQQQNMNPAELERSCKALLDIGVHRKVASAISHQHGAESIKNAIANGIARQQQYCRTTAGKVFGFGLAGYVVQTLNRALKAGKAVGKSKLIRQDEADQRAYEHYRAHPPTKSEWERTKTEALAQIHEFATRKAG